MLLAILFSLLGLSFAAEAQLISVPVIIQSPPRVPIFELWDGTTRSSGWSTRQVQGPPGMQSVGRAFCISQRPQPGMAPLRLWIRRLATGQFSYLLCPTNELWNSPEEPTIGARDRVNEDFIFFGVIGYVPTTATSGMIPIHRRFSPGKRKHYYSTNQNSATGRQPGETDSFSAYEGIAFYAYAEC